MESQEPREGALPDDAGQGRRQAGRGIALIGRDKYPSVHSVMKAGRMFVSAIPPKLGCGHFLMTPNVKQTLLSVSKGERADKRAELARQAEPSRPTPEPTFERVRISRDETKIFSSRRSIWCGNGKAYLCVSEVWRMYGEGGRSSDLGYHRESATQRH